MCIWPSGISKKRSRAIFRRSEHPPGTLQSGDPNTQRALPRPQKRPRERPGHPQETPGTPRGPPRESFDVAFDLFSDCNPAEDTRQLCYLGEKVMKCQVSIGRLKSKNKSNQFVDKSCRRYRFQLLGQLFGYMRSCYTLSSRACTG